MYKLNTRDNNKVTRSQYGRGTDFKQDFVENIGNNCYIPKNGNCFIKYKNHLSGKDFTKDYLLFSRAEQRQAKVKTSTKIQLFCKKQNNNKGCHAGFRVCPRNITERNRPLYMYKNNFLHFGNQLVLVLIKQE